MIGADEISWSVRSVLVGKVSTEPFPLFSPLDPRRRTLDPLFDSTEAAAALNEGQTVVVCMRTNPVGHKMH